LFKLAFPKLAVQSFGSYWLEDDQALMGKSSIEVKNMMAEHGIEIAADAGLLPGSCRPANVWLRPSDPRAGSPASTAQAS